MKTEFWVTNFAAPGRAGRIAKRYEDDGWDGMLFTDSQHHNGDVYQSLAIASISTQRLGLGTGVTNPLTRDAAVTAAAILSVQVESDGRAILGIGRGDSSLGHLGLRPASVAVLEDYVAKVQGYLRGEAVVQNDHPAHLKWIESIPKPPVDIAATGPHVCEVAGRVADSITVAVGADTERMQRNIDRARAARQAAGRDPATLATGAYLNVAAHQDVAVARRVVRGSIGTMAHFSSMRGAPLDEVSSTERGVVQDGGENYQLSLHGDVRAVHLQKVDDAFIDRFGVVGAPQQVVDRLGAMLDRVPLGRICMMHGSRGADPTELREVRDCLAREVLPKLR